MGCCEPSGGEAKSWSRRHRSLTRLLSAAPASVTGGAGFVAWQDRIRDPTPTVLLVLDLCADFVAEPPAARGLPIARAVADGSRQAWRWR